ncbi:MAG: hypothetical protein V7K77_00830 [Nostoc sp.]|uniref:hypothetical protein n=1 Tax=Nostoc sp. TaxID=1180 RepID=UPI002FF76114
MRFSNKFVIVTGAAGGIGSAIVRLNSSQEFYDIQPIECLNTGFCQRDDQH